MAYLVDSDQYARLRDIMTALYGDGSAMSADRRRDLCDKLRLVLDQIHDQKTEGE